MTLQDLLKSRRFKPVFNNIYKYYLNKDNYSESKIMEMDLAFAEAFRELINTEPEPHEDIVVAESSIYLKKVHQEKDIYLDVCLKSEAEDEYFSMDFLDWKCLLPLEIETRLELTDDEIAAHILWELTFWGFSAASVDEEGKKIIDMNQEN